MQKFRYWARIGFYATMIGVVAYAAVDVLPMRHIMAKILNLNLTGLIIAGLVMSLFAIKTGLSNKVSLKQGWTYYVLLAIGVIASGAMLVHVSYR